MPAVAEAESFTELGFRDRSEAADLEVTLRSTATLSAPRIRTAPGIVKLWFSGMDETQSLDQRGDGRAIRTIRVRSGAASTGLVQISLGDDRTLDPAAIRVETNGEQARIRIARSLFAPAEPASPAPTPEQATSAPDASDAPSADPAPSPSAVQAPNPSQAPTAAPTVNAAGAEAAVATPRPAPRAPAAHARRDRRTIARMAAPRGPGLGTIAVVTIVLGSLYIAVKLFGRKRRMKAARHQIEVVSSKRIGPRHQLVIVRAFGRDHLLSVNGGTTQRIASVRTPDAAEYNDADDDLASSRGQTAAQEAPARISGLPRPKRAAEPAPRQQGSSLFGAELLDLAATARKRDARPWEGPSSEPSLLARESVSGLIKLRELRDGRAARA
ncbi:MAG: flagellar biosynthetic protein FliO [Deltaproteobacteria bacterium]|nr:flagellar biosynthetic protein FliO [Deltaproteobacteria bacterium]